MAKLSDFHTYHIGCVITLGNKVLAAGWNTERGHPLQHEYNRYRGFNDDVGKLHAEIMALLQIRHLSLPWRRLEVYIWRTTKDGRRALARPCKACERALKDAGIEKIYYTVRDGFAFENIGMLYNIRKEA